MTRKSKIIFTVIYTIIWIIACLAFIFQDKEKKVRYENCGMITAVSIALTAGIWAQKKKKS